MTACVLGYTRAHSDVMILDTSWLSSTCWESSFTYWESLSTSSESSPTSSESLFLHTARHTSFPQSNSLPLPASNSPWWTPCDSYTLPNPHHNLSCPESPFQTANTKWSSADMKRGNSFQSLGHHGHWWLSGEIRDVDCSVLSSLLSLSAAAGCVGQIHPIQ